MTRQMFFPSLWISRWTTMLPLPSAERPFSSSQGRGWTWVNWASTRALFAPVRIRSRLVRAPMMALMASITMDLPAPVSPVSTLKPESNWISADSMTAIFSI